MGTDIPQYEFSADEELQQRAERRGKLANKVRDLKVNVRAAGQNRVAQQKAAFGAAHAQAARDVAAQRLANGVLKPSMADTEQDTGE